MAVAPNSILHRYSAKQDVLRSIQGAAVLLVSAWLATQVTD